MKQKVDYRVHRKTAVSDSNTNGLAHNIWHMRNIVRHQVKKNERNSDGKGNIERSLHWVTVLLPVSAEGLTSNLRTKNQGVSSGGENDEKTLRRIGEVSNYHNVQ